MIIDVVYFSDYISSEYATDVEECWDVSGDWLEVFADEEDREPHKKCVYCSLHGDIGEVSVLGLWAGGDGAFDVG